MSKKEVFKRIIKEFHERALPVVFERDIGVPDTKQILSIIGVRRSGKTFLCFTMIKKLLMTIEKQRILYINFEDDRLLPLKSTDLNDLLEGYYELYPENKEKEVFLFFDEVQNAQGWELFLRRIYDHEKVRIVITGSNAKLLSKEIATSLRGRTIALQVMPLSFKEFLAFKGITLEKHVDYSTQRFTIKKLLEEYLLFGGFPEVITVKEPLKQKTLQTYFELIVFRDVVERFSVRNTSLLKTVAKYLATNIGNLLSVNAYYESLKETTALSKETLFEYLSHLQDAQFTYLLPLFDYSLKKQQANPKKIYCIDTGLRNTISFLFSQDICRLAENVVFLELLRREQEVHYWKGKGEVDFITKLPNRDLEALNVTYTDDYLERELQALYECKEKVKNIKTFTLITKDTERKEKGVRCIPLWKWLLQQ